MRTQRTTSQHTNVQQNPAYLQYTSGSTRRPTGAVITHRALLANVRQGAAAFDVHDETTLIGWIPFFHDMASSS